MTDSQNCAAAVIAQLIAQGVTDVVLAPGSRSAPLALAAFAADAAGQLRLHVRVDERGAGFLALGLGKASGRPAAVVTTSGTAVGNLLPAVMEAAHTGVPLLVITADRPASVVGFGASQTTDQQGFFNRYPRWSATLDSRADSASWFAQVGRAVLTACGFLGTLPGPVHLNVHLGLPLVSAASVELPTAQPRRYQAMALNAPVLLPAGPRTIAIAGDLVPAAGRRVAEMTARAQVPLIAEPSANARFGAALTNGQSLLNSKLAAEIERVVVFGHPTLSRPVAAVLARSDLEIVVEGSDAGWPDPGHQATLFAPVIALADGDPLWASRWAEADAAIPVLPDDGPLSGATVARRVWESLAADAPLVVGSSSVVRELDRLPVQATSPMVFANRGLAGIDGILSTAIGVALAIGIPTTLYCGDLTFIHDVTALTAGVTEPRPDLRVVVADDHGGSLFAALEYGQPAFADVFERIFATPTGPRVADLAKGFGVPVLEVSTDAELTDALSQPPSGIEVVVARLR